jgi:hypothetical protein
MPWKRWSLIERERPMLKRDKLKSVLRKITAEEFDAIWKDTYGDFPRGERADLVKGFVAEQYDSELDGCIKRAESFLNPVPKSKLKNRWLSPR